MPERKGLNLDAAKQGKQERKEAAKKAPPKTTARDEQVRSKSRESLIEDDEEEDDDDDLLDGLEDTSGTRSKYLYYVIGAVVVVLVVVFFLVFVLGRRGKDNDVPPPAAPEVTEQQPAVTPQPEEQPPAVDPVTPEGVGTQDFTGNTNMSNSDILTNPDKYVEDLYGLTTRVDYTVMKITNIADFVSYTKHRGTWGGGLELYWLDVEYKEQKYVVQVPFQYYKELDEVGIVPVKMEVLTIKGSVEGEYLTVISYMQLDEATLKNVLKAQSK